ncbi:MAG TPA: 23S rRNA (adenine(2503)-C(2))-methyltransferase RlmN [Myxococcales bacterium]|nr:23S rRNA (adenine(2503)-C(2))-methyltransferase RlmN [Myxococcales bacterium]
MWPQNIQYLLPFSEIHVPSRAVTVAVNQIDLKSLEMEELISVLTDRGHSKFRAEQVFRWIHRQGIRDLQEMKNVPAVIRDDSDFMLGELVREKVLESVDGTRKIILRRANGQRLESVLIPMGNGRITQCVSSQVGCKMGCDFCATAEMSVRENLTASEIVDQIYHAREILAASEDRLSNLVFMGMGEPLDNFDNVVTSIRNLLSPKGAGFGHRKITVSTVGLANRIPKLGHAVPINLAVSLNATTDEQRDKLMPVNKAFPIARLLEALREFPLAPRKRIFVEYVMLGGVNDSKEDAKRLPVLLKDIPVKVNLIPFNPYPNSRFKSPTNERVRFFKDYLIKSGIQANVREPKGRDIQAACGMLDGDKPL